jgi:ABC-type dipeptide/oligopeptide/nickel transport system permease component
MVVRRRRNFRDLEFIATAFDSGYFSCMVTYFFKRILTLIPIMLLVMTLVFFLLRLIPGDPVDFILGENALADARSSLIQAYHFDKPISEQYVLYIKDMLSGNLGRSYFSPTPVNELLWERYLATLQLGVMAILWAVALSIPLGILSAVKRNSPLDRSILFVSLFGISVPTFYLGPLLALIFAVWLDWFPISGRELNGSIVLPSLTLGLAMAALLTRFTRASLLEVLHKDYVRTARAKGLSPFKVILKHAFRTALIPIIAILGLQLGTLLTGAVVTEKVFSWPGIGTLLLDAISKRDYALVQGCVLVIAATYVVVNLLTDVVHVFVDPRFRLEK